MINLIENELFKILKKKSLYILLCITLIVMVIMNITTKRQSDKRIDYETENIDSQIEYYEKHLKNLNPDSSTSDRSMYISLKNSLDEAKLVKKYGAGSWQANLIQKGLITEEISIINSYEYLPEEEQDLEILENAKDDYNAFLQKLDNDDWKSFARDDLEKVQKKIENLEQSNIENKEEQLFEQNLKKDIINKRLEKEISFADGYFNSALNTYESSAIYVHNYEKQNHDNESYDEKQSYYKYLKNYEETKYAIENMQTITKDDDARGMILNVWENMSVFVVVIIVMVAGGIVSEEFSKGTIKLLLIKPYKRTTILISKIISCIIMIVLVIVFIVVCQAAIGGTVFGVDSMKLPAKVYSYTDGQIKTINIFAYTFLQALLQMPMYILIATIAIFLSTIANNTAVSVVIALLGYMSTSYFNLIANREGIMHRTCIFYAI